MTKSLTGNWSGMFDYSGVIAPVSFHAQLHNSDGLIAGLIEETDDMLDGLGPTFLSSVVEGSRRGEHVSFRKTYDELEPLCAVDYDGVVDPEATEISGEWVRLEDGLTGSFVMRRDTASEEEVRREEEVTDEVPLDG